VAHKINNIVTIITIRGTDNANRLIQGDQDEFIMLRRLYHLTINANLITRIDTVTHRCALAVDINITLLDKSVRIAAGTKTTFTNVFIETGIGLGKHELALEPLAH
jgi:hypothetical protein